MKPTVYLETSVVSYLTAWPSRHLITAANQQITHEWWREERDKYELFVSEAVIEEASAGDPEMAKARLEILNPLILLTPKGVEAALARQLFDKGPLPAKAAVDAVHISFAAVHGLDYLLTWNCKHIANAQMWRSIIAICQRNGYEPPIICTPAELLGRNLGE